MNSHPLNTIFRSVAWTGPEIRYAGLDLDTVEDVVMHFREDQDSMDAQLPSVELSISNGRLVNNQSVVTGNVTNIGANFIEFDAAVPDELFPDDLITLSGTTDNDGSFPVSCVSKCRKIVKFEECFTPEAFSGPASINLWGRFIPVLTAAETTELLCRWYFWDVSLVSDGTYHEPFAAGCVTARAPRTRAPFGDDLLSVDPPGSGTGPTTPANAIFGLDGELILGLDGAPILGLG